MVMFLKLLVDRRIHTVRYSPLDLARVSDDIFNFYAYCSLNIRLAKHLVSKLRLLVESFVLFEPVQPPYLGTSAYLAF